MAYHRFVDNTFFLILFFMFIELRFVGLSPTQMPLGHSEPSNKVSGINIL
jgi:hypothetical protein